MSAYPLYDVPYLVRDPNDFRMSKKRHEIEVRNQAVVDDYFVARDKGVSAYEARMQVATKHGITPKRVIKILKWFYEEAKKTEKIRFSDKIFTFRGTLKGVLTLSLHRLSVERRCFSCLTSAQRQRKVCYLKRS